MPIWNIFQGQGFSLNLQIFRIVDNIQAELDFSYQVALHKMTGDSILIYKLSKIYLEFIDVEWIWNINLFSDPLFWPQMHLNF